MRKNIKTGLSIIASVVISNVELKFEFDSFNC